jgi:hypothetical protein
MRSSLLVKIQGKNIIIYQNMDVVLFGTCSHVIILTQKVDPRAEGGAMVLFNESSIKAIEFLSFVKSLTDNNISQDIFVEGHNASGALCQVLALVLVLEVL